MDSFADLLNLAKEGINQNLSATAYHLWIEKIQPVGLDNTTAYVSVDSIFARDFLKEHYRAQLEQQFTELLGFPVHLEILASEDPAGREIIRAFSAPAPQDRPASAPAPIPEREPEPDEPDGYQKTLDYIENQESKLNESLKNGNYEYTFDTFIVGNSNHFAHAACKAVAQKSAGSYNPLFIHGPSGLGKTHLLRAIQHEFAKNFPGSNIIYVSSETFTNELITAIQQQAVSAFRDKYRRADLLLIDDIQFIAGKESTQEEFFHTFNELYQVGRQVVLTSDRPPKDIKTLEDRLQSRFEGGLLADIGLPDFETRFAIIKRKASLLHLNISDEVAEFIAGKLKKNIRQLEGAVQKLNAFKFYTQTDPSISVAQTVIKEILNDNQPAPVTVEKIIEEVAKTYSVTPEDIRSNKRTAPLPLARQVSIYVVREITQMTQAAIGDEFGGRDHATIVYSIQKVQKLIEKDPHTKAIVDDIIKNIRDK